MSDIQSGDFFKSYRLNTTREILNDEFNKFMENLDDIVRQSSAAIDVSSIRSELQSKLENAVKFIQDNIAINNSVNLFDPSKLYLELFNAIEKHPEIIPSIKLDRTKSLNLIFIQILDKLKDRIKGYITDTGLKLLGLVYDNDLLRDFFEEITIDKSIDLDKNFSIFKQNIFNVFLIQIDDSKKLIESNFSSELFKEFNYEATKTLLNFNLTKKKSVYNLISFSFFDIFYRLVKENGDITIFFSNNDNLVFIYKNLSLIFLQLVNNQKFISKINSQKDALNRAYLKFYNKYKQVYTHLKIRQEQPNKLYNIQVRGKKVIVKSTKKSTNVDHIFGNFDNIFDKSLSNQEITRRLTSDDVNIINQLKENSVCIIGLGQSGSGKTSTLIQLKLENRIENGILLNILDKIKLVDELSFSKLIVSVTELKLSESGYEEIKNKSSFLENKSKYILKDKKPSVELGPTELEALGEYIVKQLDQDNRIQLPTSNNIQSSRSHIVIKIKFVDSILKPLYICDLAGVENEFNCNNINEIYRNLIALKQTKLELDGYFKKWQIIYIKKFILEGQDGDFNIESSNNDFIIKRFFIKASKYGDRSQNYNIHNYLKTFNQLLNELFHNSIPSNVNNMFKDFLSKLQNYCNDRRKEGYLINTTLSELNKDIIKLVKFEGEKKPFFFDNLIDEGCRNNYGEINYFRLMSKNTLLDNNNGSIINILDENDRNNLKMHILTVVNNNKSNIQKVKYKYNLNKFKYLKLKNERLSSDKYMLVDSLISNNSQTLLGSIEVMEQLGNFMFNSISCIRDNSGNYHSKYLKYKKKYLKLKRFVKIENI